LGRSVAAKTKGNASEKHLLLDNISSETKLLRKLTKDCNPENFIVFQAIAKTNGHDIESFETPCFPIGPIL
jgi:hypothetical protein